MKSFHDREIECPQKDFYIFERSLYSSLNVFATLNCIDSELDCLRRAYMRLGREHIEPHSKSFYIYVHTPAKQCLKQIRKRNKPTDKFITLEYLEILERKHREIFDSKYHSNCIVVENNGTMNELVMNVCNIIDAKLKDNRRRELILY